MGRDLRVFPLEFLLGLSMEALFLFSRLCFFPGKKTLEENQLENSTKNVYLVDLIRQERV